MYVQDVQGLAQTFLGLWLLQVVATEAATDADMEPVTSLNNMQQEPQPAPSEEATCNGSEVGLLTRDPMIVWAQA
jgi:hypothetical protein